ncbi:MutS-related protein [Flavimarina sp. Hel_I_48]|uniref:MutS-related protein n=1 Tax=Flavimarina sp. Hel_I_48 TaxID=1392488 RepID=UPI0004DF18A3|nr:hypothetical protein [Flavimarina sp. Hel_I_48]
MNLILVTALIVVCVLLCTHLLRKKKLSKRYKAIKEGWGRPKETSYLNMLSIRRYFDRRTVVNNVYQVIDDDTCNDLDFDQVFERMDHTSSKIGQQYLYYKLRVVQPKKDLTRFAALSSIFDENVETRTLFQRELSALNKVKDYKLEELTHLNIPKEPKIAMLLYILSIAAFAALGLSFYYPAFSLVLPFIFVVNMIFHYRNKETIGYYIRGLEVFSKAVPVAQFMARNEDIQPFYTDFDFLRPLVSMRNKTRFLSTESKLFNEFMAVSWIVSECIKILFNIEYIAFHRLADRIVKERNNLNKLFEFMGELDVAISCASVRASNTVTCSPVFSSGNSIFYTELTHPLLTECVPNDLDISNKSMLITGSNMSGKTTFIRAAAINALLAQTLHICFAKRYSTPFFKIYSAIRIADDLLNQKSYYLEEVLRIKTLVASSDDSNPCLFVMDELLKGTNTMERVSAGASIISFLNKEQHFVMVATHDMKLTQLLNPRDFELYHFTESIEDSELSFDHKLKNGPLKTRNAIKILEINGYPNEIIKQAQEIESRLSKVIDF